jgi:hypothetical protein
MVRFFLLVSGVLAIALMAACGDSDKQTPASSTVSVVTPSSRPTETPETTLAPMPSLPPIPEDWPTYNDPAGRFSIRYPSTWFASDGELYSADPRTRTGPGPGPRRETVNIEISLNPARQSNICGNQSVNPDTGNVMSTLPEAIPVELGGQLAWQSARTSEDGDLQGNTRIQVISLVYKERCVHVAAYFTQEQPDVTTFLQIASTFEFKS